MKRLALLALVLAACNAHLEKPNPAADCGPVPEDPEGLVRAYFHDRLYDPMSAVYELESPRKAAMNAGLIQGGRVAWYGYGVRVKLNAKNRMGGYTGFDFYLFLIRDDQVFKVIQDEKHPLFHWLE